MPELRCMHRTSVKTPGRHLSSSTSKSQPEHLLYEYAIHPSEDAMHIQSTNCVKDNHSGTGSTCRQCTMIGKMLDSRGSITQRIQTAKEQKDVFIYLDALLQGNETQALACRKHYERQPKSLITMVQSLKNVKDHEKVKRTLNAMIPDSLMAQWQPEWFYRFQSILLKLRTMVFENDELKQCRHSATAFRLSWLAGWLS